MLLVDIGNTRIKYMRANKEGLHGLEAIKHSLLTYQWMDEHWADIEVIYIASVAHENLTVLIKAWVALKNIACNVIKSEKHYAGLTNAYLNPENLGVDRWLAMQGAKKCFPMENLLVIDLGTATTVDFLTAEGMHRGGWIFPGLHMLVNRVVDNTANVNKAMTLPEFEFGQNTSECLHYSAIAGTVGLIEKAIEKASELASLDQIILLGGNAEVIAQYLPDNISIQDELIFHGLHVYSQ